jgi:hypothetical protein
MAKAANPTTAKTALNRTVFIAFSPEQRDMLKTPHPK